MQSSYTESGALESIIIDRKTTPPPPPQQQQQDDKKGEKRKRSPGVRMWPLTHFRSVLRIIPRVN